MSINYRAIFRKARKANLLKNCTLSKSKFHIRTLLKCLVLHKAKWTK